MSRNGKTWQGRLSIAIFIAFFFLSPRPLGLGKNIEAQDSEWEMKYDPETKSLQPTYIGLILRVVGEVNLHRGGADQGKGKEDPVKVTLETKIRKQDTITTDKNSYVKIKLIDDTLMNLAANTKFQFTQFVYKTQTERSSFYQLFQGKIRTLFRMPAGPDDLKIRGGNVAMGIRGTEILLNVHQEAASPRTELLLLSGEVEVEALEGMKEQITSKGHKDTYHLQTGTLFESDRFPQVAAGAFAFRQMDQQALNSYRVPPDHQETEILPFLEVESPAAPAVPEVQGGEKGEHNQTFNSLDERGRGREDSHAGQGPGPSETSSPKKNWREILRDMQEARLRSRRPAAAAAEGKGRSRPHSQTNSSAFEGCRQSIECLEYTYQDVQGKRVPVCTRKAVFYEPPNCRDRP